MIRKRRHPRGFTLWEILWSLSLATIFLFAAAGVFKSLMNVIEASNRAAAETSRVQHATNQLRQDAWDAVSMTTADAHAVTLNLPNQITVQWSMQADRTLVRSQTTPGQAPVTRRWTPAVNDPSQAAELSFAVSGTTLIVHTPATPDGAAGELPLISQHLLAERERP